MKAKSVVILILFLAALAFVIFKVVLGRTGAVAGLKVTATPSANVFLDDRLIGKTPYDGRHPAGESILKLEPEDNSSVIWQGKIVLTSQTLTYVKKELGNSELTTSGEVVYLEKVGSDEIQMAVSSTPDASIVSIDGIEKGITPLNIPVGEGEHDVVVNSTGFTGRTVKVKAVKGYRVNINIQLPISSEQAAFPTPTVTSDVTPGGPTVAPEDFPKPYVLIKDTPTDFLRVRFDASLSASEVAQLKPGTKVPYLDEKSGWLKVEYEKGKEGWISSRYSEKVE